MWCSGSVAGAVFFLVETASKVEKKNLLNFNFFQRLYKKKYINCSTIKRPATLQFALCRCQKFKHRKQFMYGWPLIVKNGREEENMET